jgi:hypothetical protein
MNGRNLIFWTGGEIPRCNKFKSCREQEEIIMQEFFENAILVPLEDLLAQIYGFLPNLFAMVLILLVGFVVGFLTKSLLVFFLKLLRFDRLSYRMGFSNLLSKAGVRRSPTELIGVFLYWVLFFVFIMLAISALKLEALDALISRFFFFLPNVIAGVILFFVGYLISIFIERTVLITAVNAGFEFARLLARGVQLLVLVFFLAIALELIGVGRNIVVATFTIIFGGVVLALALAMGLGGRDLARDWLERQFGKKQQKKEEKTDILSHI